MIFYWFSSRRKNAGISHFFSSSKSSCSVFSASFFKSRPFFLDGKLMSDKIGACRACASFLFFLGFFALDGPVLGGDLGFNFLGLGFDWGSGSCFGSLAHSPRPRLRPTANNVILKLSP